VENLWQSCGFNPSEIGKQLYSSDVSPEEIDLALQNCLLGQNNPLVHIPVSRHTKYLQVPYSNEVIALRHQLADKRKARTSAHEIRPRTHLASAPGPTASSPSSGLAPVPSPSDFPATSPSVPVPPPGPVPAPSPARVLPLPLRTFSPPLKPSHHAQAAKKPQKELTDNFLLIKAIVFSVLGTSLVAFILFCCYRCKKKRDFHSYSQRDNRPLLSFSLSDFSGINKQIETIIMLDRDLLNKILNP
jgi:hypothetical protein